MTRFLPLALIAILLMAACRSDSPDSGSVGNLLVHQALDATLFASEPDVLDPVALTFDAQGRMYVVEMRDYPYGVGPNGEVGSTIRLLEDLDSDGVADRSTVFATEISFPTSIVAWDGGVFVAAPPQILYLKDTDGDRVADVRVVTYDGFELGVTDSNFSSLRWGLDNWIHGVNGGNGGVVVGMDGDEPISIRGRDFRFDPRTGVFETTFATSSGFGLVFDDWGRSFSTYNIDHLQHRFVEARYLEREPALASIDTTRNISDHGAMARIFPISEPQTRPNHPEQSGYFSAAGGMGLLDFGPGQPDGLLVCDVVGNLISREQLRREGPAFASGRAAEEVASEFLASRDLQFRAVAAEHGPDGALYVADMQRAVIEHPDYIPAEMLAEMDITEGRDKGRIYRVMPRDSSLPLLPRDLSKASSEELAETLLHPRRWWRDAAQRLLIERDAAGLNPPTETLLRLAKEGNDFGRLHALWTLEGLGLLESEEILGALASSSSGLRENAVLLAESRLASDELLAAAVVVRASDSDSRVRFRVALALGELPSPVSFGPLMAILKRDGASEWSRLAVMSSLGEGALAALEELLNSLTAESAVEVLGGLADLVSARGESIDSVLRWAMTPAGSEPARVAVLSGLATGLARRSTGAVVGGESRRLLEAGLDQPSSSMALRVLRVADALGLGLVAERSRLVDRSRERLLGGLGSVDERLSDLEIVASVSPGADPAGERGIEASTVLLELIGGETPLEIQQAVFDHLAELGSPATGQELVDRWRQIVPVLRQRAIQVVLRRDEYHSALVGAIESGAIGMGELNLDLEQRRRLLRESTPEVQERAALLMSDDDYGHRSETVSLWLERLPSTGDAKQGRVLFEEVCAQCHRAGDSGSEVGPDLGSLRHRSAEDLLSNILDPNMAINPNFGAIRVFLQGGGEESGLLASESPSEIVLLQAFGNRRRIARSQIDRIESAGISLMPEGLEAGRSPQDLRDLIAFIHSL